MKVLFFNCNICAVIINYFSSIFSKLLCFINKNNRKSSNGYQDTLPFSIQIEGAKSTSETPLADWNTWGDDKPLGEEVSDNNDEFFKDMEPVINKAKVVHVKKKIQTSKLLTKHDFGIQPYNSQNSKSSNTTYGISSELGILEDDLQNAGWNDDDIDEFEMNKETESMLKYNRQSEREKRAKEQQKKKLEMERSRALKKQDSKLAVKITY